MVEERNQSAAQEAVAETVAHVEAGAEAAVAAAQEQVARAEETAQHMAEAAIGTLHGQRIEAAHERLTSCEGTLEALQNEIRQAKVELDTRLAEIQARHSELTALIPAPQPIALTPVASEQEPQAAEIVEPTIAPSEGAVQGEAETLRRRGARWI